MVTFNRKFFVWTLLIFTVEVLIALYVHDDVVRPYVGDVLVVVLMYCFFRSFLTASAKSVAVSALAIAFAIEFLQSMQLVERLGLERYRLARTVLGTSFSWMDLLMYTIGFAVVLLVEIRSRASHKKPTH